MYQLRFFPVIISVFSFDHFIFTPKFWVCKVSHSQHDIKDWNNIMKSWNEDTTFKLRHCITIIRTHHRSEDKCKPSGVCLIKVSQFWHLKPWLHCRSVLFGRALQEEFVILVPCFTPRISVYSRMPMLIHRFISLFSLRHYYFQMYLHVQSGTMLNWGKKYSQWLPRPL